MNVENSDRVKVLINKINTVDGIIRSGVHLHLINTYDIDILIKDLRYVLSKNRLNALTDYIIDLLTEEKQEAIKELEKL